MSQLTSVVESPAFHPSVVQQGTRVTSPDGDRIRRSTHSQIHRRQVVAHRARRVTATDEGVQPQLTPEVVSPTFHLPVVQQSARVSEGTGDRFRGTPRPERNRSEVVAHLARAVTLFVGIAHSQLTRVVGSPTLHLSVVQHGARVSTAGVDRRSGPPRPERHGDQVVAHLARIVTQIVKVALPQLAIVVGSPTLHLSVVQQGARVSVAGGDRRGGTSGTKRHLSEVVAHLVLVVPRADLVALPELTVDVVSPAFDLSVVQQGARKIPAGRDRRGGPPRPERHRNQVVSHLARAVTQIDGVALTQLSGVVETPTLDLSVVQQGARVGAPDGYLRCGTPRPECHRSQVVAHLRREAVTQIDGVALTQLSGIVETPTLHLLAG